jgi:signal transduction histidine kinase
MTRQVRAQGATHLGTERSRAEPRFSTGDAVFERLFQAHRWDRTRLGPINAWPLTLQRYSSFILKLPTPAIIFWGSEHLQIYNAGYAVIMGPRHPGYLGATYAECWPDTYPTIDPWMDRVLRGEVVEVENAPFTLTRHGFSEETYFTFSFSPLLDDAGAVGGFLQIVVETTREVLAARRVALLRALAPEGATARSVPDVLATNPQDIPFSCFYLWSHQEERLVLSGQSHFEAPPEPPPEVRKAFAQNAAQPIDRALPGKAVALPVRRTANEPPRGVIVLGISPHLRFDDTYNAFFEAVAREISAGLAAEQERTALLAAERERQNLFDFLMQTPAPIAVLLGPKHRFLLANRSYIEFVGGRDVVGKDVYDAFEAGTVDSFIVLLDDVYRTGKPYIGRELPLHLAGLPDMVINLSYVPLRSSDGAVKGILAFHYDVTPEANARRRSESLATELQAAVRARDEFLGIASHELKTPLTSARLQIQMAQRGTHPLDPAQLLKQADRLLRLIEDMLDVSRIDAGRLRLERSTTDLAAVAAEVLDRFEPQAAAAGCKIVRDLSAGVAGEWDAYRLEQVITNLLTNAVKYAPGRPIEVSVARRDSKGILTVRDHGNGVRLADRERVFRRFERAANVRQSSGLGLGLFISRQIVEAHGGRIGLDDAKGDGACFVVELPLR